MRIDIEISLYPISDTDKLDIHGLELGDQLGDKIRERDECNREDDRHHTDRIHRDRQRRRFFDSSSPCIDDRDLFDGFEDEYRKKH